MVLKVIEKLAIIKYPTPPTEDNPCGTLSYLPARAQWAGLQILKIQRTMVDAGAIPLKPEIACYHIYLLLFTYLVLST